MNRDAGLSVLDIRSACDIHSEDTWQKFRTWTLTVGDCEEQGFYKEFVALYELCEEHGVFNERIRY